MAGKSKDRSPGRPARSPEEREHQLTALAYNLAEEHLRDGTASSQIIHHLLKVGSKREDLELERLRNENLLLEARTQQIANAERMEELYSEAIRAMKTYNGKEQDVEYDDED